MQVFADEIKGMLAYYEKLRDMYNMELAELPPGHLSCVKRGGRSNFFGVTTKDGKRIRKGITKDEHQIKLLARKEYIVRVLPLIERNIGALKQASNQIRPIDPRQIASDIPTQIGDLPKEYFLRSDDSMKVKLLEANQFIADLSFKDQKIIREKCQRHEAWAEEEYQQIVPTERTHPHMTSRGLMVRSKSEALICERLYQFGIPFRYEQIVRVGRYDLAPDFTFEAADLSLFYYEHAGMMSSDSYRGRHSWKLREFEKVGIEQWDNLIVTYDSNGRINLAAIDAVIRFDILPRL